MYCQSCGKQIPDDSRFCRFCGVEQAALPTASKIKSPPPPVKVEIALPDPPAPRRSAPAARSSPAAPPTPSAPVSPPRVQPASPVASAPVVTSSGEWDETDFVVSFAGRNMPSLRVNGLGVGASMSEAEARQIFWKTYQSEIDMKLTHWTDLGWQPVTPIAPEALQMRRFSAYKDKSALYWVLMLLAAIPSVGISLIVALIPSGFVEPLRFVARLRAKKGTRLPA